MADTTTPTALEAARAALPPLPDPWDYAYEWDGPYGSRKLSVAPHNGRRADRSVPIFTADHLRDYAAQAVVAALAAQPQGDARPDARALLTEHRIRELAAEHMNGGFGSGGWRNFARAIEAEVRAALPHPSPQGDARALPAEPVAWQYRTGREADWCHCPSSMVTKYRALDYEVRPLYAAPVATPATPAGDARDEDEALDLLAMLFSAYENGTPCYEDGDPDCLFLGSAVRVEGDDFHRCADLLNRRRPAQQEPRA